MLSVKVIALCFVVLGMVAASGARAANPVVVMETSMGTIKIELFEDKAPITVKNFLDYVDGQALRRADLPPRHRRLHDPGRRVRAGDEGEEDQGPDQERVGQRAVERSAAPSPWPAPRTPTAPPPSSSSTSRTTTASTASRRRRGRLLRLRPGDRGHGRGGQDQGRQDRRPRWAIEDVPDEDVVIKSVEAGRGEEVSRARSATERWKARARSSTRFAAFSIVTRRRFDLGGHRPLAARDPRVRAVGVDLVALQLGPLQARRADDRPALRVHLLGQSGSPSRSGGRTAP